MEPEHYIPISNNKNKAKQAYVIIPKDLSYRTVIIAEEIVDTVYTDVNIKENCSNNSIISGRKFTKR